MKKKKKLKKVWKIYHRQREFMYSGGDEIDLYGIFRFAVGIDDKYKRRGE